MDQDKVLLEIVEKIGAVTATVKNMESMLDRSLDSSKVQHEKMWDKIDAHSKWINRMKGVIIAVGAIFGAVIYWIKHKFGA